jgi:hypothetical protein
MSSIKDRVMRTRAEKYKQVRDDKRVAEGRPPRWVGTATELAAYCVPNKSDKSFHARFRNTNTIYDTIPDGRKQALRKKTLQEKKEAGKCPICGGEDSQGHRYLRCQHAEFVGIREHAHKLQGDAIEKLRSTDGIKATHLTFASGIMRIAWTSPVDPERLWNGTWNEDTLWRLCIGPDHSSTVDLPIQPEELMKLRKIIKSLTQPLMRAIKDLWTKRNEIINRKPIQTTDPTHAQSGSTPLSHCLRPPRTTQVARNKRTRQSEEMASNRSIDEYTRSVPDPNPQSIRTQRTSAPDSTVPLRTFTQAYLTEYNSAHSNQVLQPSPRFFSESTQPSQQDWSASSQKASKSPRIGSAMEHFTVPETPPQQHSGTRNSLITDHMLPASAQVLADLEVSDQDDLILLTPQPLSGAALDPTGLDTSKSHSSSSSSRGSSSRGSSSSSSSSSGSGSNSSSSCSRRRVTSRRRKRSREEATPRASPNKRGKPTETPPPNIRKRTREEDTPRVNSHKRGKMQYHHSEGTATELLTPGPTYTQDPDTFPDSKDNP